MTDKNKIFAIKTDTEFSKTALEIFKFQSANNSVYSKYLSLIGCDILNIKSVEAIPFLPIDFFKSQKIISDTMPAQKIFTSSGTTGSVQSKHYVTDTEIYENSFFRSFELFFGKPADYCILALLPSYLERDGSSLTYMVEKLIEKSNNKHSGFYLYNFEELYDKLQLVEKTGQKSILLGVSFALLDFFEKYKLNLKNTEIMETGGMKGRRKELIRIELHNFLSSKSGVENIYSEYGMTELLSQAYSKGDSKFQCPPWMRVLIRDVNDPFSILKKGQSGGINIIDLANINSCSFIETKDLGKLNSDNSFEVSGRFDNSDVRGCNLMVL